MTLAIIITAAIALGITIWAFEGDRGMSDPMTWGIAYCAGYFLWFGYAVNRFCHDPGGEEGFVQACVALFWPLCLAIYLPYRLFQWMGVRWNP